MLFKITSGAVVVNNDNEILLKRDPRRGWELPGGVVEAGETFKDAVMREVKEETGIDIEVLKFCGTSHEISTGICHMWWLGKPIRGELQTSSESLEVGFFNRETAIQLIEQDAFKKELLICLEEEKHPFYLNYL